jgi:propanol-preferring alcohol dehydrogenase
MRALVYRGPHRLELEEVAAPRPAAGEVLVEVTAAGVCGTDHHIVAGELGVAPGTIPGHEIAGRVSECGPGVSQWKPGARVASWGQVACGRCDACRAGRSNRCTRATVLGMGRPGGFAEVVALPAAGLVALPDAIDDAIGAIATDAIATPLHALTAVAGLRAGESVIVVGAGGLGLHAIAIARALGAARIVAVDPSPAARSAALAAGADAALDPGAEGDPRRALAALAPATSLALECVGRADAVELALGALAPGGRLVIVGVGGERPRLPPLARFVAAELCVRGAFGSTLDEIRTAIAWIAAGRLDTLRSVGRRVPLAEGAAVFASAPGTARTVLVP